MSDHEVEWARDRLRHTPKAGGVYAIYSSKPDQMLYVGSTNNIRDRLLRHFDHDDVGYLPSFVLYWVVADRNRRAHLEEMLSFREGVRAEAELRRDLMRERR